MKVSKADVEIVETSAGVRLATRYGAPPERRTHVLVRLEAEGLEGWGEASPLTWFTGETTETVATILRNRWLPLIIGAHVHHVDALLATLAADLPYNSSAMAAIDMAVHDLRARATGLPLFELLGGHGAETLRRTLPLGIGDVDDTVREAQRWVAAGYTTLKMKIGFPVEDSCRQVATVREAVGENVRIRVDANAGYDLASARRAVELLAPLDIEIVEQPLPADDFDGWRALRASTSLRLMADESLRTPAHALKLVSERVVDVLLIKLIKTGGIRRAAKIAGIAEAAGVECIVSTPFDTEIGAAAALHTAFAIGSLVHSHDLPPHPVEAAAATGWIGQPAGPGIGVHGPDVAEVSWAAEADGLPE